MYCKLNFKMYNIQLLLLNILLEESLTKSKNT